MTQTISIFKDNPVIALAAFWMVVLAIKEVISTIKELHDLTGVKTKGELDKDKNKQQLMQIHKQINEIEATIYRNQSMLQSQLSELSKTLCEFQAVVKQTNKKQNDALIKQYGDQLEQMCNHYVQLGYIPAEQMKKFRELFDLYVSIGGNHGIDDLFNKTVSTLPLKSAEEIQERGTNHEKD